MKIVYLQANSYEQSLWEEYDSLFPGMLWSQFFKQRARVDLGIASLTIVNTSFQTYRIARVIDDQLLSIAILSSLATIYDFTQEGWESIQERDLGKARNFITDTQFSTHLNFVSKLHLIDI